MRPLLVFIAAGGVQGVANKVAPLALAACAEGSCVAQVALSGSTRMRMMDRPICPLPVPNAVSICADVRSAIHPAPFMPPKPRTVW